MKRLIKTYIVARESHEDGSPHIHAYLELDNKINVTNPRTFDLVVDKQVYHPNA